MAEYFPQVKKYRGDGRSEISTVKAKPIGEPHTPFTRQDWESILQICGIKVLEAGEKQSVRIYGTIDLLHNYGKWKLYNGQKGNADIINLPGDMALTPPTFGISAYDPIVFKFNLEGEFEEANSLTLAWCPFGPRDEVMLHILTGVACTMEVSYVAFDRAVLGDIQIYLLNNSNTYADNEEEEEEEHLIYGSISASFPKAYSLDAFSLFKKEPIDAVLVKTGEAVPLQRPLMGVLDKTSFEIHVHLKTVSGVPVAGGTITLGRPDRGKWEGVLGKRHGQIQVRAVVEFRDYSEHDPTIKIREEWPIKRALELEALKLEESEQWLYSPKRV